MVACRVTLFGRLKVFAVTIVLAIFVGGLNEGGLLSSALFSTRFTTSSRIFTEMPKLHIEPSIAIIKWWKRGELRVTLALSLSGRIFAIHCVWTFRIELQLVR